jgi:hypothetical protein
MLDETYERILTSIDENDRAYAFRTLQWLILSARSVSAKEVAEAMTVDLDCDFPHADNDRALHDPQDILSIRASLVVVSHQEVEAYGCLEPILVLQVAHFSVKEFQVSTKIRSGAAMHCSMQETPAHKAMAECCLAYLLQFDRPISYEGLCAYPLALYSAFHWTWHARRAGKACDTVTQMETHLLMPTSRTFLNWRYLCEGDDEQSSEASAAPLYYMALTGVTQLAGTIQNGGADVTAMGGKYGNELQDATKKYYFEVVQLLVDKGADINAQGGWLKNALQAASLKGNVDVVRLLRDKGADFNAHSGWYGSALQAASLRGHLDIVRLLISMGADVNAQGGLYGNALQAAPQEGNLDLVRLLLGKRADYEGSRRVLNE